MIIKKIVILLLIINQYNFATEVHVNNFDHLYEKFTSWDKNLLNASLKIVNDVETKISSEFEEYMMLNSAKVALFPQVHILAVAYSNGIHIWHLPMRKIIKYLNPFDDHDNPKNLIVTTIAFSNDGQKLAVATTEPQIIIFDISDIEGLYVHKVVKQIALKENQIVKLIKFSEDDQYLYFRDNRKIIYGWTVNINDEPKHISSNGLYTFLKTSPKYETVDQRFKIEFNDKSCKVYKNSQINLELDIKGNDSINIKNNNRCSFESVCTIL